MILLYHTHKVREMDRACHGVNETSAMPPAMRGLFR